MPDTILVLAATGHVGRPLVKALLAKGAAVRAGSRSGAPVEGAEGIRFDFTDPATFGPALDGVAALFVLAPTGTTDPLATLLPVIEAAAGRKVKVVLMTALGVDASAEIPYRQVELALMPSGTPWVILRPNWFSDNFHNSLKPGIEHGAIMVPAGDGKSSFIDARDIAESAAAALTSDRFDGRAFNLTGPEAHGYAEAAAMISKAIGKPVAYVATSDDDFVAMLTGAGVPEGYARFLASIFYPVREGWTAGVTGDVEELTGHPPRSLATYVADNTALLSA